MFLTDKFCYINIPKNASRSILSKLNDINIERIDTNESQFLSYWYNKKKIPFSFTFTRNPYSRAITSYNHSIKEKWVNKTLTFINYLKLLKIIYIDCDLINENDIFEDEKVIRDKIIKKNNKYLYLYDENVNNIKMIIDHSFPQYKYIVNNENEVIVNFIGKIGNFSEINEDWGKLSIIFKTKLDLDLDNKLPLLNERSNSITIDYNNRKFILHYNQHNGYNDNTKELIYKIYRKDFELLNYDKDNLPNLKKDINFKLEKELNDAFFDLYEIMNKTPQSEKVPEMIINLLRVTFDSLKKRGVDTFYDEELKKIGNFNENSQKIMYIVQKYFLSTFIYIYPKYIVN